MFTFNSFLFGYSLIRTSNKPPAKSPDKSGVKVLYTVILSIRAVGKISNCTELRSGSKPGISTPFRIVFVYLSPKPLTKTYFPP